MAKKPGRGHNSGEEGTTLTFNNASVERLRSLIERVERLEEEKSALGSDIKDIFAEAKSAGFDTKVMRAIIRERKQDSNTMAEHLALLDVYRKAMGMDPIGL